MQSKLSRILCHCATYLLVGFNVLFQRNLFISPPANDNDFNELISKTMTKRFASLFK